MMRKTVFALGCALALAGAALGCKPNAGDGKVAAGTLYFASISVQNAPAAVPISINITGATHFWSMGDVQLRGNQGVNIQTATGSPIPLQQFSVANQNYSVVTATGGGSQNVSFTTGLYILSTGGETVDANCNFPPSATVTISINQTNAQPLGMGACNWQLRGTFKDQ